MNHMKNNIMAFSWSFIGKSMLFWSLYVTWISNNISNNTTPLFWRVFSFINKYLIHTSSFYIFYFVVFLYFLYLLFYNIVVLDCHQLHDHFFEKYSFSFYFAFYDCFVFIFSLYILSFIVVIIVGIDKLISTHDNMFCRYAFENNTITSLCIINNFHYSQYFWYILIYIYCFIL